MVTIIVTNQKEFDALPSEFKEYTYIYIQNTTEKIIINKALGNSSVIARENSSVEACGNSSVVAWENSSVIAWGNSSVIARENSSVEAWENSSVEALGNSSVIAWENSSVIAWENSSVIAWGNSSVIARENSSVEAFDFSMIAVISSTVIIKKLLDYSVASLRGVSKDVIKEKSDTSTIVETPSSLNHSFETYLERGYVMADGILKKLFSQKTVGEITIFTVQEFPKKTESFVVKKGDTFSHGETVEKAIADLRYKLTDRDTSRFKEWNKKTKVSLDDAIQAYRAITGACEFGTKEFVESQNVESELTISEVIKKTKGQFGHEEFKKFFKCHFKQKTKRRIKYE